MKRFNGLITLTVLMLLYGSDSLPVAQTLPSEPARGYGASVTGAFEGWFENQDGSYSFLVGYLNRNRARSIEIPVGPMNRIEPGGPDRGQPTTFLPDRHFGMFVMTIPKSFDASQRLTWTLTVNGVTNTIPLWLNPDYNISPFGTRHNGVIPDNTPPRIWFQETKGSVEGPVANPLQPMESFTAAVGQALTLPLHFEDDAQYSSNSNAPASHLPPPVRLTWSKYRGPGNASFSSAPPSASREEASATSKMIRGVGMTAVRFSEVGDYLLHVVANDYSGDGGGGEVCCWTTSIVRVVVAR